MALPMDDLISWLTSGLPAGTIVLANWMPPIPDAVVVVGGAAGSAPTLDGTLESGHLHIRSRGDTDTDAESLALAVHSLITAVDGSLEMGATHVVSIESAAGPPAFLLRDTSNRVTYLATYLVQTPTAAA